MPVKTTTKYKNWQPIKHNVIKNAALANTIHEKGYSVIPFLNDEQLNTIISFYHKEHKLSVQNGGMFYSLYSKDIAYRKRVNETLESILNPLLEKHFVNYKNIVNTFITKATGPASEFYVHQDTTALDEYQYSPLSIWIPLQDITPENGALGVIEKTHWFFSPYRGISFPSPFQKINALLRNYLTPIYLKAGEAIVFDPRIVHHSMPNISDTDRLVVLCGVFPKDAEFTICYKDPSSDKIELLKQEDLYILENESFFYDCHSRPKTGIKIKEVENDFPEMNTETFEKLCDINGIKKVNEIDVQQSINCQFIAEPNGVNLPNPTHSEVEQNATWWNKIKQILKIETV